MERIEVTDLNQKLTKVYDSLRQLQNLGMNIPEIILWNKTPLDNKEKIVNVTIAESYRRFIKSDIRLVLPGITGYGYISRNEYEEYLKDYKGDALLVLRAPKTIPLVVGSCVPGPYYNRITIAENEHAIIWSYNNEMPFPIGLRKAVLELNKMVQRARLDLDGMRIVFTFHSSGEGFFRERIVLWGSYLDKETS